MDKHILVVEDSPTQSLQLSLVLEDAGYTVIAAGDGLAARKHLETHSPLLVISDITMPGLDGFQLCRAIRCEARFEKLPILLLTELSDVGKVLTGLASGADAFISKPFDPEKLLARVKDLITGSDDEVSFAGRTYRVPASGPRIMRFLSSTYENALQTNTRLAASQAELRTLNAILEERVRTRTADLSREIENRKTAQSALQVTNRFLEIASRHREREALLREFVAEIRSSSGDATAAVHLREHGRKEAGADRDAGSPGRTRIPIKLGQKEFGFIVLGDENGMGLPEGLVQVLAAASAQLAAALLRIEAEQTLRESEEKYRHFFEEDMAGAVTVAPDGVIRSCNPAFVRMFGFADAASAIGSSVIALHAKPGEWEELLAWLNREGRIATREAEYHRTDGISIFVIENVGGTFDAAHALVEVRQYMVDVTERRGLEQQLFQSQKMEAIGQLAGGVAHDFNNILQVIQGFTDHLLNKTPVENPQYRWLAQIRSATEKAAALTKSLLAFSRKQEQHRVVMNLNDVLQEIAMMVEQLLGEQAELTLDLAPDLQNVEADRSQVEQVLMNLAVNARDAMPRGGRLTFATSNVVAIPGAATACVLLSVRDTGSGMDRETMEHMFEPFFTTKEKGKGTGLGLATVYGIVKQAGGKIGCISTPGVGTEFRISLPQKNS